MAKVSVIVPVCQVEAYIEDCARSLFGQTLEDVEFIFVNDASQDRSMEILEKTLLDFPERRPNVKFVSHNITMGIPVTRQDGFKHATGEFVIHCDSDDWWEPDAFEELYSFAVNHSADIVVFDYYWNYTDGREERATDAWSSSPISSIMRGTVAGYLWNKMISRSLYNRLTYIPKNNMWDDVPIVIQLLNECTSPVYYGKSFYHYRQRASSTSNDNSPEKVGGKMIDACSNADVVEKYLASSSLLDQFSKDLTILKFRALLYGYPLLSVSKQYRTFFRETYPGLSFQVLCDESLSLKSKIGFCLRRMGVKK